MAPSPRLEFLVTSIVVASLVCGCVRIEAPRPTVRLTQGPTFELPGKFSQLGVTLLSGDSVMATWSFRPDDPLGRVDRRDAKACVALSARGGAWNRIVVLDSTGEAEPRLIRTPTHRYVLLRPGGGLFRVADDLDTTLVAAVDLPGGHFWIDLDATVIEPDTVLVAYSAIQTDPHGRPHHLLLLGHWLMRRGLARLDTVGTFAMGGLVPRVRIARVGGQVFLIAYRADTNASPVGPSGADSSPPMPQGLTVYTRTGPSKWRSIEIERRDNDGLRDVEVLARSDSLELRLHGSRNTRSVVIGTGLGGGSTAVTRQEWSVRRSYNEWIAADGSGSAPDENAPRAWVRTLGANEIWGPVLGSILQIASFDQALQALHAMLIVPSGRPGAPPLMEDVSQALQIPRQENVLETALSATDRGGALLFASGRGYTPYRLQLVRYFSPR